MRQFLPTSFILLALFISAAGVAPTAHAAVVCTVSTLGQSCDPGNGSAGVCRQNPEDGSYGCGPAVTNAAPGTYGAQSADAQSAAKIAADNKTSTDDAYGGIMQKIASLFAWLTGVAAITLDNAVYYTVVTMGTYVHNLTAVGVTWRILRDLGNIMLIFGFLAVGITTILNVDWYGSGKKMLPMMFVAAVFLNFSLFITEGIIDTGNLFATQFYTQINGGQPAGNKGLDMVGSEGISNKIMAQLGMQNIYGEALTNTLVFKAGNSWLIGFMSIILFIITAFVFFSLAFILIARFVALIFLIIAAPIGFAGLAVPGFEKRASEYWTTLFEQTITAPILLLMLYIALAVITDAQFMTGFCIPGASTITGAVNTNTSCTSNWLGFVSGNFAGFASMILSFLVAMGLLLLVIVYAKRWSAFGGDWASRMGAKLSFGATAWAGRRTIGRATTAAAARFKSSTYARSNIGRLFAGGLDKVAGSSFDVRGTGVLKTIPFGSNIDVGKAQEGGYAKIRKDATEVRTKYSKTLELTEKEDENVKRLEKDQKDLDKDIKNTSDEISELNSEIKQAEKEGKDTSALRARKKSAETSKESQGKRKEVLETQVTRAKNIAQIQYAEGMKKWSTIGGPESLTGKVLSVPYSLLVGPVANKDAAKKILKEAKKSKSDKDLDTLKKLLEDSEKKSPGGAEKKEEEKKEEGK